MQHAEYQHELRMSVQCGMIVLSGCKGQPKRREMNIEQLNVWGAYFTAKDASEKKHGFISTWEVPSRHPWNVSEKAEFEKAQAKA